MITISGKALGQKKPLFADWSIPLPPEVREGEGLTLRRLIEQVVRIEVAAFRERKRDRQFLRVLTSREIEAGAERGKIEMGGAEFKTPEVDEEAAVDAALTAFADGLYLVAIDGAEQRELDREVHVADDSRVTFIRLTLLAGG